MSLRALIPPFVLVAALVGCAENEFQAPPPPPVTVASPAVEDVIEYVVLTGRTEALHVVQVPARVQGVLQSVDFAAGDRVEEGQVLFRIDPEPFVAARDAAQASVNSAEAQANLADTTAQRMESSAEQGAISEVQALEARAQADVAAAQVEVAVEQLKIQELDVTYTNVVAPISGRAMASDFAVGALVGTMGSAPLTTIYDDSQIYVWFTAPDRVLLEYLRDGADKGEQAYPEVDMATEIDDGFPHRGIVDYIDPAVDPQTGTVRVRALFDNPEMRLTDGLFVRVRIASQTLPDSIVVPETAIGQDQAGRYVYVVDEQNLCRRRDVQVGPVSGAGRVVTDGLEGAERVIVRGLLKVRPDAPVTPIPADASGQPNQPPQGS